MQELFSFPLIYTHQANRRAEGSTHRLMDERLVLVMAQDVNVNGVCLSG